MLLQVASSSGVDRRSRSEEHRGWCGCCNCGASHGGSPAAPSAAVVVLAPSQILVRLNLGPLIALGEVKYRLKIKGTTTSVEAVMSFSGGRGGSACGAAEPRAVDPLSFLLRLEEEPPHRRCSVGLSSSSGAFFPFPFVQATLAPILESTGENNAFLCPFPLLYRLLTVGEAFG